MRTHIFTLAAVAVFLLSTQLVAGTPVPATKEVVDETDFPEALKGPGLLTIDYKKMPPKTSNTPGLSRSPCPFMNSAANHGLIPYSGLNIKLTWLKKLLNKVGMTDAATKPFTGGMAEVIKQATAADPSHPQDAIHLADLNIHGIIEHHVSLTRPDVLDPAERDALAKPNLELIDGMFAHISETFQKGSLGLPLLTYEALSSWRAVRNKQESEREVTKGVLHKPSYGTSRAVILGSGEAALLLEVFGKNGEVAGKDAKLFFFEERFPDGWTAHKFNLPQLVAAIAKATISSQLTPKAVTEHFGKWKAQAAQAEKISEEVAEKDSSFQEFAGGVKSMWHWAFGRTPCPECRTVVKGSK